MAASHQPNETFNQQCQDIRNQWETGALSFKDAIANLSKLLKSAVDEGHIYNQAMAELTLGIIQHYRGNLNRSIQHYQQARKLASRVDDRRLVARSDLNQGENYRYKGDIGHALRLYRSAYEEAKAVGYIELQTVASVNEGLMLVTSNQFSSAQRAFERGITLSKSWDSQFDVLDGVLCEIHYGLMKIYLQNNRLDDAWNEALKSWEIAQRSPKPMYMGYAYRTIGRVISAMDESPSPEFSDDPDEYFSKAIESFKEINAEAEIARTKFAQAMSQADHGDRVKAASTLQQVMIIFTRLGMMGDAARAAEAQGRLL